MKTFKTKKSPTKDLDSNPFKKMRTSNVTKVHVMKLDPITLAAYAEKTINGNIFAGFTFNLTKALNDGEEWTKDLNISCVAQRRSKEGANVVLMSKGCPWSVYFRVLEDHELCNANDISISFGESIAQAMNKHVVPSFKYPEVFQFGHITNPKKSVAMSDFVTVFSITHFSRIAYADTIKDGSFFEDEELISTLFPGVDSPKSLFY